MKTEARGSANVEASVFQKKLQYLNGMSASSQEIPFDPGRLSVLSFTALILSILRQCQSRLLASKIAGLLSPKTYNFCCLMTLAAAGRRFKYKTVNILTKS